MIKREELIMYKEMSLVEFSLWAIGFPLLSLLGL